ncbi:transcriptional regulator GcvA [Xanthomonas nasturtii]|uniref:Transcriptional regulator GcvA n=2 Tax=Xanthomonas nasturtii TaxID=1843581 RepID=A0A3E1KSR9_9XANT|nr:transcriptional regulator GcvA [Xanthomonas nasturtii]
MKAHLNFTGLRALEAAARHRSFSGAAGELHVTPAAIGQLVRALEDALGVELFVRDKSGPRRLTPTDATERALPDIRAGMERLTRGLSRLQESAKGGLLTVTTSPAFASKWLLPRLERFQCDCPETDVRLHTGLNLVDFEQDGIDIGVRYGRGQWAGLTAEKLMDEEVFPVCSAAWLQRHGPLERPAQLQGHPLIHDSSVDGRTGFMTWQHWLHRAGADNVDAARGMQVNNSAAVLQSAIEGKGLALARSVMAQDDVASGRLVRLFPERSVAAALAYYVVYRPECASLPKVVRFKQWLHEQAHQ